MRREALQQEWLSAFPTLQKLLDFVATPKAEHFSMNALLGEPAGQLALEIAADPQIDYDPMYKEASSFVESPSDAAKLSFVKEALSVLYRVGAIGIKMLASERIQYSHIDAPIVAANMIPDEARIRIHPMLHAALQIGQSHDHSTTGILRK